MKIQIDVRWPRFLRDRPRRARLTVVGLVAAGVIAVPMALASDIFTDVGDANPFHNDIGAAFRAGITGGKTCVPPGPPPTYCPSEGITREAMAAFVHRGFGRVGFNQVSDTPIGGTEIDLTTVTLQVGGLAGTTQFVKVDAAFTAYISSATGCPCSTLFRIQRDGGETSLFHYTTNDAPGPTGLNIDSGAATMVVAVPAGTTQTFRLKASRFATTTGSVAGYGALSAISAPFGSTGTNVLGESSGAQSGTGLATGKATGK